MAQVIAKGHGRVDMRTVHLIHGFNEKHKVQHPKIGVLRPLIESRGHRVMVHDYGTWDLVAVRNNENLARLIYPHVKAGDSLIGFSNGAAIIAHLDKMGTRAKRIVLIQPALSKRWVPNKYTKSVAVFWNTGDDITVWGKWWRRTTGLLPWNWQEKYHWGEMGDTGYVGDDPRFYQYQTDKEKAEAESEAAELESRKLPKVSGHGAWCRPENVAWWEIIVSHA